MPRQEWSFRTRFGKPLLDPPPPAGADPLSWPHISLPPTVKVAAGCGVVALYSAAVLAVLIVALAVLAVAVVAYGWFEAGWLRTRVLEVELEGLPEALDGLRIGHLSDFHLGAPLSRGNGASARAVDWVAARKPDFVCVTGDLVSHPRGEPRLRALLARLDRPYVILGNHDVAVTRDPFSRAAELRDLEQARLLRDDAETVTVRGETVSVVGVDPETYRARRARPHTLVRRRRRRSASSSATSPESHGSCPPALST